MPLKHGIICRQPRQSKYAQPSPGKSSGQDKRAVSPGGAFDTVENRLKIISMCVNDLEQTEK